MSTYDNTCTVELLKKSFRKLLTYAYYDKTDMYLRHSVAQFSNAISKNVDVENKIFERLCWIVNGVERGDSEAETALNGYLEKIRMQYFPKKLKSRDIDKRLVTNEAKEENEVERFLIKPYIPIELLIIDVLWLMQYGDALDASLSENSCGNRLVLDKKKRLVRDENVLFYRYYIKYQKWWMDGIKKANEVLEENDDISIINLDVSNYYHSIDLKFDGLLVYLSQLTGNDEVLTAGSTEVLRRILNQYWSVIDKSGLAMFHNSDRHPLPLGLMSSAVIANWYLKPLDDWVNSKLRPLYYGRYVDDMMIVVKTRSNEESAISRAIEELKGLIKEKNDELHIDIEKNGIDNLVIQKSKIYVYSFTSKIPQLGIEKYVSEQMSRSSEFRFITDEVESAPLELENVTLVGAMDANYEEGKRFDILEESRFRLSVYLAKLASRIAKKPEDKRYLKEVKKIFSYFRGALIVKHYVFWERILSIFVLAGNYKYFNDFVTYITEAVDNLACLPSLFLDGCLEHGRDVLRSSLCFHLEQSKLMALSLHKGENKIESLYSDAFMVRMHFNTFPMQEFSPKFKDKGVKLSLRDLGLLDMHTFKNIRWIPYYVKLSDIICIHSLGSRFEPQIFIESWRTYCNLNGYVDRMDDYKKYISFSVKDGIAVTEFNPDLKCIKNTSKPINVSLVGFDIRNNPANLINSFGVVDVKQDHRLRIALDKISEIPNTDLFVMPEASLTCSELKEYCRYSARNRIAYICGLEYYICSSVVYNYIITCLPVWLYKKKDAIPIIRLKNFYAPLERDAISSAKLSMPDDYSSQALYHWQGHIFTTYCCFELCNPRHRSFFFNSIDAMYCPVYNRDTYYFNNIAESTARDMHCFFVLSNVSGYGDSRVSVPAKHDRMNLMKVKGGNTSDNVVTVLSCTLDYNELRCFQKQYDRNKNLEPDAKYKPLPPGFRQDELECRKRRFLFEGE